MRNTTRLRQLMASDKLPLAAAAYDGLTAKLVCQAGFDVVTAAGFQIAAAMGLPDAEIYTMSENLEATRRIVDSSTAPVMADCDTGYGNAINVMRTVREFERAGVGAVILEDQVSPKRCPAMMAPEIISLEEGVGKIKAAVAARTDPDLVIIGRTDATSVEEACQRTKAYAAAGADMVLTINRCAQSFEELRKIRQAAGVPMMIHLMGWVENLTQAQLREVAGCAGWAFPTLLTVTESLRTNLAALRESRDSRKLPIKMEELTAFKQFIGFPEVEELQRRYIPATSYRGRG